MRSFHTRILTERLKAMNNSVEQAVSSNVDCRRMTPWTTSTFPQYIHKSHSWNRRIILKWIVNKTKCESVNCIHLNRGTVRQRAFVTSEMKVSVPLFDFLNEIHSIKLFDVFLTVHHSIDFSKYKLSAQLF